MTYPQPVVSHETPHRLSILSLRDMTDQPSLHAILAAVSEVTQVSVLDIKSPRRERRISHARFIYYTVARQRTTKSFPQIARLCCKHHTTIINGCNRIKANSTRYQPMIAAVHGRLGEAA